MVGIGKRKCYQGIFNETSIAYFISLPLLLTPHFLSLILD